MTQADKDIKPEQKIATVDITVEGEVVYSKSVFVDDIGKMKAYMDQELDNYDEAN